MRKKCLENRIRLLYLDQPSDVSTVDYFVRSEDAVGLTEIFLTMKKIKLSNYK